MANRFWVGGNSTWSATAASKWATTSGGAGGASVPTSADDVFFDAASTGPCTVALATASCKSLTFTGFSGTFTGSSPILIYGGLTVASGMAWTHTGALTFLATSTAATITLNGNSIANNVTINGAGNTFSLADAFVTSGTITLEAGTLNTNNYNVTTAGISSNFTNTRTINLGSSVVTLSGSSPWNIASTGMTLNAGTSSINLTGTTLSFAGAGLAYNNLSVTSSTLAGATFSSGGTFNNFSVAGRTAYGLSSIILSADLTINGIFSINAGTDAARRVFVRSNTLGTTRTLTCAAVAALTDVDFRDIAIAGTAAPVSGTRLGNCKGNRGITFAEGVTRYWNYPSGANWFVGWASTSGGTPDVNNFPLAQDTAVFEVAGLNSGGSVTINAAYNIGTVDMSARTSVTTSLDTGSAQTIYGNWINGAGTAMFNTGTLTFSGRGSQTITSAGRTFSQSLSIISPNGSVALQDAFVSSRNNVGALTISAGTFDANNYNVTLTGSSSAVTSTASTVRTIAIGSGTWTLSGITAWNMSSPATLTVTGTGTISLINASNKNFIGAGVQTYPTLNQGGTGTLTVTNSNRFANITNTAIGRVQFNAGETNIFTAFNLSGTAGNPLQLGSSTAAQTTLQKGGAWLLGANSTNVGNNTGLSFTAGGGIDYLSISYINGTIFNFYTPLGSIKVDITALTVNATVYSNAATATVESGLITATVLP
jgi:hypothetical protein